MRRELGRRITIHTTPQLHFLFDQSLEHGADLSKLIAQHDRGGGRGMVVPAEYLEIVLEKRR